MSPAYRLLLSLIFTLPAITFTFLAARPFKSPTATFVVSAGLYLIAAIIATTALSGNRKHKAIAVVLFIINVTSAALAIFIGAVAS